MKLAISFTFSMLGLASIALADPVDLDPNAHPLPPQAIGLSAKEPGPPPRMAATASAAPTAPPSGPCIRGQSQVRMGGIDIDEIKCELAVVRLERNAIQERLERILAAGSLVSSDLAAARENTKQREATLAEWFKGYFGEPLK